MRLLDEAILVDHDTVGAAYCQHFVARNGEPNFDRRVLPKREHEQQRRHTERDSLQRKYGGTVSQTAFDSAREARRTQSPRADGGLVDWLAAISMANDSEAWGVECLLSYAKKHRSATELRHNPRRLADLEEVYHTHQLREIVSLFGLEYKSDRPPRLARFFIRLIARAPERAANMLLASGELVGTIAFARLLEETHAVLATHPELDSYASARVTEILVDEVGHVTYLLGSMRRRELLVVRLLLPVVLEVISRSFLDDTDAAVYRRLMRSYDLRRLVKSAVLAISFIPKPMCTSNATYDVT